jgi:phage terminase small subunit
MPAKMTKKQKIFCEEYLVDLNATQAAIRAGYSVDSAREIGNENMKKPIIRTYIEQKLAERSKRTGINADRVIQELAKIALLNITDVVNADDATIKGTANRDDTAAILSVKVKTIPTQEGDIVEREVKMNDKIKALELLGKHLGMFKDKLELSGELGVQIIDDIK